MHRFSLLSLIVCAFVVVGCQRGEPAQPESAKGSTDGDVIEATTMKTGEAPLASQTPTPPVSRGGPQPAPEQPLREASPVLDNGPGLTRIPEAWDMKPGDVQNCRDALGEAASKRLVERCIQVSPATHPPCNAANPCALIQGEIDRACAMYGPGETKPKECAA